MLLVKLITGLTKDGDRVKGSRRLPVRPSSGNGFHYACSPAPLLITILRKGLPAAESPPKGAAWEGSKWELDKKLGLPR